MSRLNDMSLILTKAKRAGFFEDVKPEEVDFLEQEAKKLFGSDIAFPFNYKQVKRTVPTTMVTTFANGHAWSASGTGAGTNLNDTAVFSSGSQSAKVVTDGVGTAAFIEKTGLTVNLTGKCLRIKFKVGEINTDYLKVNQLIVYAGDSALANTYSWTVMQPESAAGFQYTRGGEWAYITLSFADAVIAGTPNRAAVTHIRLRSKDESTGPLTVWWDEVAVVEDKTSTLFSGGVVTLAFDDCDATVASQAIPKMSQYGFPGTIFSISDVVGTTGFLTLEQMKIAERDFGWEVAAHSNSLADHSLDFTNISIEDLRSNLRSHRSWLETNGFRGSEHIAYPKGGYNESTLPVIKEIFASGRGTVRRTKYETLPPADPYRIRTFQVYNTDTAANINGLIDKAVTEKAWLILTFHIIRTPATAQTMYLPADFATIIDYLNTKGIPVRTYGDVLNTI